MLGRARMLGARQPYRWVAGLCPRTSQPYWRSRIIVRFARNRCRPLTRWGSVKPRSLSWPSATLRSEASHSNTKSCLNKADRTNLRQNRKVRCRIFWIWKANPGKHFLNCLDQSRKKSICKKRIFFRQIPNSRSQAALKRPHYRLIHHTWVASAFFRHRMR